MWKGEAEQARHEAERLRSEAAKREGELQAANEAARAGWAESGRVQAASSPQPPPPPPPPVCPCTVLRTPDAPSGPARS